MTYATLIEALTIFAKYADGGMEQTYPLSAEHDCIYVECPTNQPPEGSEERTLLGVMGWSVDEEVNSWRHFV